MQPVKEYGFKAGGLVADWACEICKKIVYPKTNISDIPRERLNDICLDCRTALDKAHQVAEEWWKEEYDRIKAAGAHGALPSYFSKTSPETGVYALRDDLVDHLLRGVASDRLKRFAKRLGKELPVTKYER